MSYENSSDVQMCSVKVSITHETITYIRGKKSVTIMIMIPSIYLTHFIYPFMQIYMK